ncbi:DNA-directed RNA polymerase subunit omega [Anaplasma platys]|uniref:DNA-directed RNA polymerase subunit omega n=1 Tax=Anaplasma platys TaxID=949 RepID=A0A858PYH4_9RICK|nr:DNA-directed RNA polymerase subunit omega [Anaplasma platys]
MVARKGDKNTVVALREMASDQLDLSVVFGLAVQRCKKYIEEFANSRSVNALGHRGAHKSQGPAEVGRGFAEKSSYSGFLDQDKFLSSKGDVDGF